jgi:signal recognition particle subunit SEC65
VEPSYFHNSSRVEGRRLLPALTESGFGASELDTELQSVAGRDGQWPSYFDSFRDAATGQQIPTRGFLNAERNLLENHGWKYNPQTGAYHPPGAN